MSSKKILDPNEQGGEIVLLFGLYGEFFEPAQDLSRKKEELPQHDLHGWPQRHPEDGHCQ